MIKSSLQGCTSSIFKYTHALQIVCTLGPKSRSVDILEELLRAGMSVARFNFSHGSHEYHQVPSANMPSSPKSPWLLPMQVAGMFLSFDVQKMRYRCSDVTQTIPIEGQRL